MYNQTHIQAPLPGLIKRDNELVSEIKKLDGDKKVFCDLVWWRKTLVYENYSKFISASDTIREMRKKIDAMDTQVSKLSKKMDGIGKESVTVNASLNGLFILYI